MKLAYRLLLVVGHTLGDLALPLLKRQCANVDATMETLTAAQAERIVPALEKVLEGYLAKHGDLKAIVHEMRLEIGAERFAKGEVMSARVAAGAAPPRAEVSDRAPPSKAPKASPTRPRAR